MILNGMRVFISDNIPDKVVQIRFPRTKKKRIQKKWRKDLRNYKRIKQSAIINGMLFVDRETYCKLKETHGKIDNDLRNYKRIKQSTIIDGVLFVDHETYYKLKETHGKVDNDNWRSFGHPAGKWF